MSDDLKSELAKISEAAEFHAFSVRQLQAQRERLYAVLDAFGGIGIFPNKTSMADVASAIPHSRSQFMQDIYALLANQGKRKGFFVEFGACDGLEMSNTKMLEERFEWTGILAEPSKYWQPALKKNRPTAKIDKRCVSAKTGEQVEFTEAAADHTQSTTAEHATDANKASHGSTYKVATISLLDLLKEHKAPKAIDFMSVDVEGPEFSILKSFHAGGGFKKYRFNFMCVEHHSDSVEAAIKSLLASAGYKQVHRVASGHDGYYVPA